MAARSRFFELVSKLSELASKQDAAVTQAENYIKAHPYRNVDDTIRELETTINSLQLEWVALRDRLVTEAQMNQDPYFVNVFDAHCRRLDKMNNQARRRWYLVSRSLGPTDQSSAAQLSSSSPSQPAQVLQRTVPNLLQVQERSIALQRITQDIVSLGNLFQQVDTLVQKQDTKVSTLENQSVSILEETNRANDELNQAVASGRSYRKSKRTLLLIIIVIIIFVGVLVGVVYGVRHK